MPWTRTVPSGSAVQFCAAPPLHGQRSIGLPGLVLLPKSSRQPLGICDTTGPAGSVHFSALAAGHDQLSPGVPLAVLEPGSARHMAATRLTSSAVVPTRHSRRQAPDQASRTTFAPCA